MKSIIVAPLLATFAAASAYADVQPHKEPLHMAPVAPEPPKRGLESALVLGYGSYFFGTNSGALRLGSSLNVGGQLQVSEDFATYLTAFGGTCNDYDAFLNLGVGAGVSTDDGRWRYGVVIDQRGVGESAGYRTLLTMASVGLRAPVIRSAKGIIVIVHADGMIGPAFGRDDGIALGIQTGFQFQFGL